jgi:tetratricopeptide (TPR) repeat protein
MGVTQRKALICFAGLFLALLAAYSNHFGNGFHFDDAHAVVDNPAIRTLAGIPRFFSDTRTFSSIPQAQSYRPLVTTSLAVDYALGGGLDPFWFHVSTFFWFVVQLLLMYALYMYVLERSCPNPQNAWIAWFAVAIYGLHPVSAETINYVIQRGDLYVALGMVAGVVIYAWKPTWRRYGLYLIPPLAAMFAKPTALVFAPFLLLYIVLVDRASPVARQSGKTGQTSQALRTRGVESRKRGGPRRQPPIPVSPRPGAGEQYAESLASCFLRSIPAFVASAAFLLLENVMTPPYFFNTTLKTFDYLITQPYVTLRYFRSFFLPFYLNMDTDLQAFRSLGNGLALAGCLFCALLVAAAIVTAARREWRPVSFGLWWFLIGLIPTAIYPLNEVENDHRMFLPFIGLTLAVVWTGALLVGRGTRLPIRGLVAASMVVLAALAWGTHRRNEVWRTDETLWRDDIEKSPNNARGHDQLGAALSNIPGRLPEAISEYGAALRIKPDFANAHMNLGKALAKIPDRLPDAIQEFEAALRIEPDFADAHLNLGAALVKIPDRLPDAIQEYRAALRIRPDFVEAHNNLGVALSKVPERLPEAISEYQSALRLRPDYSDAHRNLGIALSQIPGRLPEALREFEATTTDDADAHMSLGVALSQIPKRLPEEIAQYEAALRIKPDYADAHTALGIALARIPDRVPEAISEFKAALRLQPDSAQAHKNLGVALAQAPGRLPEAISEFEVAYRIKPDPAVRQTLDNLRSSANRRN